MSTDLIVIHGGRDGEDDRVEVITPPPDFSCTDVGNGQRLVYYEGDDLLWCDSLNRWLVYDGTRWREDDTQEIERRAKKAVRRIYQEAKDAPTEELRAELLKWGLRSEASARLDAMAKVARSDLPVSPAELDRDLWLFNVQNGTVNLRGGVLQVHDREDRITKISPAVYVPGAECPLWMEHLRTATDGDESLMKYLQRFFGSCLVGNTRDHVMAFMWGTGRNGKSVTANTMHWILGDYSEHAQSDTLMQRGKREQSNDIAVLMGARMVMTTEIEEGSRLSEALVKQLTGGDPVKARRLYAEFVTFTPHWKIVVIGNHKPVVRGTDVAIWERIHLIPFTVTIPPDKRDPDLAEKLKTEAPGILNWLIAGCMEWQKIGLSPPEAVLAATEEYREEMDLIGQFIEECCLEAAELEAGATALYEEYKRWSGERGIKGYKSMPAFGSYMTQRGLTRERLTAGASKGRIVYRGIGLLDADSRGSGEGSEGSEGISHSSPYEKKSQEVRKSPSPPSLLHSEKEEGGEKVDITNVNVEDLF